MPSFLCLEGFYHYNLKSSIKEVNNLKMIHGDTTGLKKIHLTQLEEFYKLQVPYGQTATEEILHLLAVLTTEINRELALYINRHGTVTEVAVGDIRTVSLPQTGGRRSELRLSGIRCIHSHPGGDSTLSTVDESSLKKMRFDMMAALGVVDGVATSVSFGFINGADKDDYRVQLAGPLKVSDFLRVDLVALTADSEKRLEVEAKALIASPTERALLVGVERYGQWDVQDSLQELSQLAETAGAVVVGMTWQKRDKADAALYIGRGKVEEIALLRQTQQANLILFDDELSPAQQRNLEQAIGCKVVDRTALILDIFAQRARTYEGKLQVELAQLRYNLPRLGGQGLVLSRLGGGIGTRGPGETKLEVDRRHIRGRISDIEKEIENISTQRHLQRQRRKHNRVPTVALVGYTNAGKSSLLNKLTASDVLAEDKLFATLDPTTRRIELPNGQEVLLTDTVGFIQKLPHQLIAAFRATLEEVVEADLLLHVVDVSHPKYEEQMTAVYDVLRSLHADGKPAITVYNKIDLIDNQHLICKLTRDNESMAVSAVTGQGLDELLALVEVFLRRTKVEIELKVPYSDSGVVSQIYNSGEVLKSDYSDDGICITLLATPEEAKRYRLYMKGEETD